MFEGRDKLSGKGSESCGTVAKDGIFDILKP